MTAYEILRKLLGLLREAGLEADFRESHSPGNGRLPQRPVAVGQVGSEGAAEGKWSARLDFQVYLPRKEPLETGEALLAAIGETAEAHFSSLSGIKREGFGPDKEAGLLCARCFLEFAGEREGGGACQVLIGGVARPVSGWEISVSFGKPLTAVGENEPFALLGGAVYRVKLLGLDTKGLERLAGFTAELPEDIFTRCRWESLEETGRQGVFLSGQREERGRAGGGA